MASFDPRFSNMPSSELVDLAIHIKAKHAVVKGGHLGISPFNKVEMALKKKEFEKDAIKTIAGRESLVEEVHDLLNRSKEHTHTDNQIYAVQTSKKDRFEALYNAWKRGESAASTTPEDSVAQQLGETPQAIAQERPVASQTPEEQREELLNVGATPSPLGRIKENLNKADEGMTEVVGQGTKRTLQLKPMEEQAEEFRETTVQFKKETQELSPQVQELPSQLDPAQMEIEQMVADIKEGIGDSSKITLQRLCEILVSPDIGKVINGLNENEKASFYQLTKSKLTEIEQPLKGELSNNVTEFIMSQDFEKLFLAHFADVESDDTTKKEILHSERSTILIKATGYGEDQIGKT
jgi:hypothetical protein